METRVKGEEGGIDVFLRDIIDTFRLTSPTIVYDSDEEAPEICYTDEWVLCLHPGMPSWYPEDEQQKLANESDKEQPNDGTCIHKFNYKCQSCCQALLKPFKSQCTNKHI